jgi:hypothetical protein
LRCAVPCKAVKSYRDDEAEVIDLALVVLLNDVGSYNA